MCDKMFLSVQEVAKRLSVSPQTIRREIRDGKLNAVEIRNTTRITAESFSYYLASLEDTKGKYKKWRNYE